MTASHEASMRALLHAVGEDDVECVRALLEREPRLAEGADESGCTALIHAARLDRPRIAELLLEAGARPEARDTHHGTTALGWAAYFGSLAVARLLVDAGVDVRYINPYGLDPGEIAAGGARGEHVADAPDRRQEDFLAIVELIARRRNRDAPSPTFAPPTAGPETPT